MSTLRHCHIYLAVNDKWYMDLAPYEDGESDDATTYGPFDSEEATDKYLSSEFSNPGGYGVDGSGKSPVPTISPNGRKVETPTRRRW